ncbi:hypothetical protein Q3G72_028803 [Acer saccharum]|nr:hypothetical protein Q3G72_028803 [Acer saccharum]
MVHLLTLWLQAIFVLTKVVMLNPCLPDTYHTLVLVYDTIDNAEKAAGFYELAAEINPKDSTPWKWLCAYFVQLYLKSGRIESSVGILEDYFKSHPSEANSGIIDLLASVLMETNAYDKALQHIEHSHLVYYFGEELPLNLKIRAGICHIHLGNMEKSEESVSAHAELIIEVADTFKSLKHFNAALKHYHMLEANGVQNVRRNATDFSFPPSRY